MLTEELKKQLEAYLQRVVQPITLRASLDDGAASLELRDLLQTLGKLSAKIKIRFDGADARRPSFSVQRDGTQMALRFAAIPLGHEFTSLVLALLWAGGHPPKVEAAQLEQIHQIEGEHNFEVMMSLSCHNCPDVVQAFSLMSVINEKISTVVIDGALFQEEMTARNILAVPMVFRNGQPFGSGHMSLEEILAKLDTTSVVKQAQTLSEKSPFDMLVVGAGPAGAAAAVYAARKGIRTGMVYERMGGQTADTMGIENYISVMETTGPQFTNALSKHVNSYQVDTMSLQRVAHLIPAQEPGGLVTVELESGAKLQSKAVIVSTGARWRNVNVPGEEEYKNRGVAYCPHCDGPLFKGKRVAVIGGGNSGVEAAIDLAGIVEHVTLIEYAAELKADAVLTQKLRSLPNVRVVTSAQTTAIEGDGAKVTGLAWRDRESATAERIALAGVFVQIGLVPNTEFLKGSVELTKHGEIIVDARGATSMPGVYAAGDATTVPFKQIVIAAGDGAKAALGAFDYLMRAPAVEMVA